MSEHPPDARDQALALLKESGVQIGQRYRHYKGGVYTVTSVGIFENSMMPMIGYCLGTEALTLAWQWYRWLNDFQGHAVHEGNLVPRFTRILDDRRFPHRFPIITDQSKLSREVRRAWPQTVPWWFVEPARARAKRNHDQTLEELARRGGLSPQELWCALHGHGLFKSGDVPSEEACGQWLIDEMKKFGDIS